MTAVTAVRVATLVKTRTLTTLSKKQASQGPNWDPG